MENEPLLTSSVRASAEEKKAEAAKKKAERDALLAEEEANTPGRAAPKNAKSAAKKTRGIDAALGEVDAPLSELNATGIENALDALGLVDEKRQDKIDRHPERRKWKYAAWKERRLEEMKADKDEWAQRKKYMHAIEAELWKEWKNSPENPMNQVHAAYNSTQQDISALRSHVDEATENRLAAK